MDSSSAAHKGKKPTNWLDPSNISTIGVKFYNNEPAVTYIRGPKHSLTLPPFSPFARPHIYQPLPAGYARFLKRSPQLDPNVLVFEFISCPIKAVEDKYAAISYCWGTLPANRSLILADGSYISITTKVENMLPHIISRIKLDLDLLWLDTLCINQKDTAEKALQIPLMANIYQSAASVEVWLDSGRASLDSVADALLSQSMSTSSTFATGIFRKRDNYLIEPYSTPEIVELMWSPWFNRAWVVQEFCFGKNHQFHCGDITITELFLTMVYEWGSDLGFGRAVDENGRRCEAPIPPMIRNLRNFFSLRTRIQEKVPYLDPLEDILCRFYNLKTSDPHDKIFAMLGFCKWESPQGYRA